MKNLIPQFILEKYEQKKYFGNFKAATMFIDISGFTAMTQTLMKNGKEGSEVLTDVINKVFTPSIEAIYNNYGFVSIFAGDAFTAIFKESLSIKSSESNLILRILHSAIEINKIFKENGLQKTKYGNFQLAVKIGLSLGDVEWKIIKSKNQNSYYFRGEAIDNCALSEHNCDQNEIIVDENIKKYYDNIEISKKFILNKKLKKYYLLTKKDSNDLSYNYLKDMNKIIIKNNTNKSISKFIPKTILTLKTKGEFRNIVSCFISFKESKNFEKNISEIITLATEHGGYFNKIDFGDKGGVILVLFGAPSGKEKLFIRASDFAISVNKLKLKGFHTRIGLTFGSAFTGFVGSNLRNEYTALGDVVNLSARFIMKAEFGDIYTINKISDNKKYNIKYISEIKFKGFLNKIKVYKLLSKKDSSGEISDRFSDNKLIGREKELEKLKKLVEPIYIKKKNAGIIYVDGIAGVGKSRFIWELKNRFKNNNDVDNDTNKVEVNWFFMPSDEILKKSFNPILHFLNDYFEQSEDNTTKQNKQNINTTFSELRKINCPIWFYKQNKKIFSEIKKELLRTKSIIGGYLGIEWKNSLYSQLDGKGRFENFLYAIKNLIKLESLKKPVIIELDDGHLIDEDSKKILDILMTNTELFPIVIISACRYNDDGSKFEIGLSSIDNIIQSRINLGSLSKEGSNNLILEKLNVKKIADKTINLILDRSGGNPFFIEQIILYFNEKKMFDEKFNIIKSSKFEIPTNINAVIIARIDRLKMELKDVIKTASVLGREFAIKILAKMLFKSSIEKHLSEGTNEVIWSVLNELKYIFKHALIREAVYEMQLKKELRELHKLAGEIIEDIYKLDIKNHFADLANHFEIAEILDKTIDYLKKAGDHAKNNYENENALELYNRLLNRKKIKYKIKIETLLQKGKVLQLIGKWNNAEIVYREALDLSNKNNDIKMESESLGTLGEQLRFKGNYNEAIKYYDKKLKICKKIKDKNGISLIFGYLGLINKDQSKYSIAMKYYNKKLKICKQMNDKQGVSLAFGYIGYIHMLQGDYQKAIDYYLKKIVICEKLMIKQDISRTFGNIGLVYFNQGNYFDAMENYKKNLKIKEELGDKHGISKVLGNIGNNYYAQNNYIMAMKNFKKDYDICTELGDKNGTSRALGNIGNIYEEQGNYKQSMVCYEKSLEIKELLKDRNGISGILGNMGVLYRAQGNYQKGLKSYKKQLEICKELGDKSGRSIALGNIGEIYCDQGKFSTALTNVEEALKIAIKIKANWLLPYWFFSIAEILYKTKDFELAKENNKKCLNTSKEVEDNESIFYSKILNEKIEFELLTNNKNEEREKIVENLCKLLKEIKKDDEDENNNEENKALLNYEIAIMLSKLKLKSFKKYRNKAISIYKKMIKSTPNIEYINRSKILQKIT